MRGIPGRPLLPNVEAVAVRSQEFLACRGPRSRRGDRTYGVRSFNLTHAASTPLTHSSWLSLSPRHSLVLWNPLRPDPATIDPPTKAASPPPEDRQGSAVCEEHGGSSVAHRERAPEHDRPAHNRVDHRVLVRGRALDGWCGLDGARRRLLDEDPGAAPAVQERDRSDECDESGRFCRRRCSPISLPRPWPPGIGGRARGPAGWRPPRRS